MSATDQESREFADAFQAFLGWVHGGAAGGTAERAVALVRDHLGDAGQQYSVVTRELPPYEQVNLQTALNSWMEQPDREVQVHGLSTPPHYAGLTLQQLLSGDGLPPLRLASPELVDLPNGPGSMLACVQTAVLLVRDRRGAFAIMVRGPERHQPPSLTVEIAGLPVVQAQQVHGEIAELSSLLNVYRGQVLELSTNQYGSMALVFAQLPETTRRQVVLPEPVLRRAERHTIEIARHRNEMLAAGQHLKRGLLLFGPPGSGKTHTVRYLIGRLKGYTVLLLSGQSLHLIGAVAALARELQPAVIVLEDVDLVAEDRGFGPGASPVLFELLDVMDGAAADADLVFLLTTNRADLLEPALAARPGRVDVAVEIGLPDADARRRLFDLYAQQVPLQLVPADVDLVVERTAGMTASFVKELLRRAVLEALQEQSPLVAVTGAQLARALDDMLDSSQQVTRALLSGAPSGPGFPHRGAVHGGAMFGGYSSLTIESERALRVD